MDELRSRAPQTTVSILFTLSVLSGQLLLRAADIWSCVVGNGTNLFDGFGTSANVPANKAVEYLTVFNGQIYAAVGQQESGSGNSLTIWRSSDFAQWTQVGATVRHGLLCCPKNLKTSGIPPITMLP
jgi:hypothetical protein